MHKPFALGAGLILATLLCLSCQQADRTITVSGSGTVTYIPDTALLSVGVKNVNPTLAASLAQTKETVQGLYAVCRQFKVADADVKTSYVNTDKEYNRDNQGQEHFAGYSSSQNTQVTFRDLKEFEAFTAAVLALRVSSIDDIQFTHSKAGDYSSQADLLALDDAQRSAEKIAARMKVKLGKVRHIANVPGMTPSLGMADFGGRVFRKEINVGVSAAPGILSVSNTVDVVYDID